MKTKFGNARINSSGYYNITTRKGGNKGKFLHKLIWEDFYGKKIPEGYDIHHKDGNPLNNEIWNLQCCEHSKHMSLHHKNKNISDETKYKISVAQNTSGYMNVTKNKKKDCKQGFIWMYQYYVDGKRKAIVSVDIKKLEQKVKSKGLLWKKLKEEKQ